MISTTYEGRNGFGRQIAPGSTPIDQLFAVLAREPLDRTFEAYGNFRLGRGEHRLTGEPLYPEGFACFWGNFHRVSNGFHVVTNDAALAARLEAAITRNQLSTDYLRQPPPFRRELLEIKRIRFSTTQGEVLLTYAGERLEQYGDTIGPVGGGRWEGHLDAFWVDVAKRDLANRHAARFDRALTLEIA